ncbi:hypothetical protein PIB30_069126, partial [Stylosanthes scabra]|nr:hypothetical protein [Stylosanthes scabra]
MAYLPTHRRTTSTHMRGKHTASMKRSSQSCSNMVPSHFHAYAWKATLVTFLVTFWRSKRDPAYLALPRATHMCRTARICVEGKLLPNVFKATHMRRSKAYAWKK